jgi:hypothetical protein
MSAGMYELAFYFKETLGLPAGADYGLDAVRRAAHSGVDGTQV